MLGKRCLITNSSYVLFLLCFLCSEYTVWVFLLLPAGTCLNCLLSKYDGVLSLGWMCGWSYTRGTWGGVFFSLGLRRRFLTDIAQAQNGGLYSICLYSDTRL